MCEIINDIDGQGDLRIVGTFKASGMRWADCLSDLVRRLQRQGRSRRSVPAVRRCGTAGRAEPAEAGAGWTVYVSFTRVCAKRPTVRPTCFRPSKAWFSICRIEVNVGQQQIKTIAASAIETAGLQVRAETCAAHIDDLVELFDEDNPTWPDSLPPVVVFCGGKTYWLADGHHRLAAAIEAGCTEIRVNVHSGTREEAMRFACGANAGHGLRRTNSDKRNAVAVAYKLNPGNTERGLAKLCRVSNHLVADVLRIVKGGSLPPQRRQRRSRRWEFSRPGNLRHGVAKREFSRHERRRAGGGGGEDHCGDAG